MQFTALCKDYLTFKCMHCKPEASLTRMVTVAYSVPLLKKTLPKVGSKLLSFFVCEILIVLWQFVHPL